MMIKYAEQTSDYEVARKYSVSQGKHLTVETTKPGTYASSTQQLSFIQIQR
jgi:hypothetical protein